jgi:hypothetical protein
LIDLVGCAEYNPRFCPIADLNMLDTPILREHLPKLALILEPKVTELKGNFMFGCLVPTTAT